MLLIDKHIDSVCVNFSLYVDIIWILIKDNSLKRSLCAHQLYTWYWHLSNWKIIITPISTFKCQVWKIYCVDWSTFMWKLKKIFHVSSKLCAYVTWKWDIKVNCSWLFTAHTKNKEKNGTKSPKNQKAYMYVFIEMYFLRVPTH